MAYDSNALSFSNHESLRSKYMIYIYKLGCFGPLYSSLHSLNGKFMMESQNDELEEGPLSDLSEIAVDSKEKGN